jgi:AraC-like DNA-binding protein
VIEAERILRIECHKHRTVDALARCVRSNRTDLEMGFYAAGLGSVHTYQTICRVRAAARELRTGCAAIDDVAKGVGYRGKAFYRAFEAVMSMTPDEYRRAWTLVPANERVVALIAANRRCRD